MHMLRCLECAILHLRDFVSHTHTQTHTYTHSYTGKKKQKNTHSDTHTQMQSGGKSIRNQSTRQGSHSVRNSREVVGGGGGMKGGNLTPYHSTRSPPPPRKCGLIYSTRLLARLFPFCCKHILQQRRPACNLQLATCNRSNLQLKYLLALETKRNRCAVLKIYLLARSRTS